MPCSLIAFVMRCRCSRELFYKDPMPIVVTDSYSLSRHSYLLVFLSVS